MLPGEYIHDRPPTCLSSVGRKNSIGVVRLPIGTHELRPKGEGLGPESFAPGGPKIDGSFRRNRKLEQFENCQASCVGSWSKRLQGSRPIMRRFGCAKCLVGSLIG